MATTQYIGARYVPLFFTNPDDSSNNWKSGIVYDPLTIVTDLNQSYTSKIPVPASVGRPSENPEYWILTGAYNAQVAQLSQDVTELSQELSNTESDVQDLQSDVQDLQSDVEDLQSIVHVGGVIRKVNNTWSILPPSSGHTPAHLASITPSTDRVIVAFDQTFSSVGGISVTPDEDMGMYGLGVGASVAADQLRLFFYRTRPYGGMFDFTPTGAISYSGDAYKGDIASVEWTGQYFKVTFKDYVKGGAFNTIDFLFAKDAALLTQGDNTRFLSDYEIAIMPTNLNFTGSGRCWVQCTKSGYFMSPDDVPNMSLGNVWISGFMYN